MYRMNLLVTHSYQPTTTVDDRAGLIMKGAIVFFCLCASFFLFALVQG